MARPKNKVIRTYTCQGRLNRGTNAHELLEGRRIQAGVLFDAVLNELAASHQEETLDTNQSQLLTTTVSKELGIQKGPLRNRCRIAIAQKAVNAWNHHVKNDHGLPRQHEGKPVRTIDTFAHNKKFEKPLITFNEGRKAKLHFPGLPPIRLYSCRTRCPTRPTHLRLRFSGRTKGNRQPHLPHRPRIPAPRGTVGPLRGPRPRPRTHRNHRRILRYLLRGHRPKGTPR